MINKISQKQAVKNLKQIGRGAFTRCYYVSEKEVLLLSSCPIKEAMAHGWFPRHSMFPAIKWDESIEDSAYKNMSVYSYRMKNYGPTQTGLKSLLTERQYKLYKELNHISSLMPPSPFRSHDKYHFYNDAFNASKILTPKQKEALIEALSACSNYGADVTFECSPRNVRAVKGKLVLLDCFFMASALMKVRG